MYAAGSCTRRESGGNQHTTFAVESRAPRFSSTYHPSPSLLPRRRRRHPPPTGPNARTVVDHRGLVHVGGGLVVPLLGRRLRLRPLSCRRLPQRWRWRGYASKPVAPPKPVTPSGRGGHDIRARWSYPRRPAAPAAAGEQAPDDGQENESSNDCHRDRNWEVRIGQDASQRSEHVRIHGSG